MIKKYLKTLIITSIMDLSPIIIGIILWDRLPDKIATHFGVDNTPDGWSSKAVAVFGLPLVIFALEWICMLATKLDPKYRNIDDSVMMKIVLWLMPCLSIMMASITYAYALGKEIKVGFIVLLFIGALFVVMGNYLPKCKQSYTMGIKLPWTLNSEENWNKTHRLGGKVWVAVGMIMMLTSFFESPFIMLAVVLIAVIVPTVYSYKLYKDGI